MPHADTTETENFVRILNFDKFFDCLRNRQGTSSAAGSGEDVEQVYGDVTEIGELMGLSQEVMDTETGTFSKLSRHKGFRNPVSRIMASLSAFSLNIKRSSSSVFGESIYYNYYIK